MSIKAIWIMSVLLCTSAYAVDTYTFDHPTQEAQYQALVAELRCPKCQNQNLAGSDAPIAQDLKQKTYEMVKAGQTDQQIRDYMTSRYGDFISYRPPVRPSTWVLWFAPPLLLLVVLVWWFVRVSRRAVAPVKLAALSPEEQAQLDALRKSKRQSDQGEAS
jgi:cytochrome c-type biogenesis protein CcmH